jgi:S-formylglutathione hydrolase FrmB
LFLVLAACFAIAANSPAQAPPAHGSVQHITVHGKLLEANLLGDSADRPVNVYLPPSYATQPNRRYPVVYLLHGFTDSPGKWFGEEGRDGESHPWIDLPQIADRVFAADPAHEMILVMPNAYNKFEGSFYSSSAATGDWEDYIASELVAYTDQHYRTLARPESRGLGGHSMGGYGTLRIGMKHADVFSAIYALSPCCLRVGPPRPSDGPTPAEKIVADPRQLKTADFLTMITLAWAAAWSPDPKAPPFYLDLATQDGKPRLDIVAKWVANMPLVFLDQAIAFDAGTQDQFKQIPLDLVLLDQDLTNYGIPHAYSTYEGTHTSRIANRLEEKVLPFFAQNLSFAQ